MSAALPHFQRLRDDPVLPFGEIGVCVAAAGIEQPYTRRSWLLHGTFCVPLDPRDAEPEAVLRRIVLVLRYVSTRDILACRPFRDTLVFSEDVCVREGGFVSGAFHVDLLSLFELISPFDTYFISASIGEHVSEVIQGAALPPESASAEDEQMVDEDPTEEIEAPLEYDDDDPSWMIDD